jgi:hypothetical protein
MKVFNLQGAKQMRILTIAWIVTDLILAGLLQPVCASDAWYDRLRDEYKYQKRMLDREYDRREDELARWHERADDRVDHERQQALRRARDGEAEGIFRAFRERRKSLQESRDRREQALRVWHDQSRDLLRDRYDAAKDWFEYEERFDHDAPAAGDRRQRAPVYEPVRGARRLPHDETVTASERGPGRRRSAPAGSSWLFRYR